MARCNQRETRALQKATIDDTQTNYVTDSMDVHTQTCINIVMYSDKGLVLKKAANEVLCR